jgi:hypothetical protein
MALERFRDDGRTIYDFLDIVLVVCPQCGERADVRPAPSADDRAADDRAVDDRAVDNRAGGVGRLAEWLAPRRLTCARCGLTRTHDRPNAAFGRVSDPYFGLPLALQAPCAGHVVWAYNLAHLDHLLAFVSAKVRERPAPMSANDARAASLVEKMPTWFGVAANRSAVTATLRRLRSTVTSEA